MNDRQRIADLEEGLRPFAEIPENQIRDEAQGLCCFCVEGWEQVPGPRGGKGKHVNTNRHDDACPILRARSLLSGKLA